MANHNIQILQFGTGNFLRAFFESMVQDLNEQGNELNICIVQSTGGKTIQTLAQQEYSYHVLTAGVKNGHSVEEVRKITCIKQGLQLPEQADQLMDLAAMESIKWIVSNVTEAGMVWKEEVLGEKFPESFPGRLTVWLWTRFQKYPQGELVILPCELLTDNGNLLKSMVIRHAENWKIPAEFFTWLSAQVTFLNSLVDRIVPGFPSHLSLKEKDTDPLLVQAEPYSFWAIEGSPQLEDKLPFLKSNAEVVLTPDISKFSLRKVRILNGAHTAMTGLGLLKGVATVGEWMKTPELEQLISDIIAEEIIPTLPLEKEALTTYASDILDRFRNPFVAHKLSDISLNSVAKIKSRILPTLFDYRKNFGKCPEKLSASILSLLLFYLRNQDKIRDTQEVKAYFMTLRSSKSEVENITKACRDLFELEWNEVFEKAWGKLG
jgi:tagaturonate reductase